MRNFREEEEQPLEATTTPDPAMIMPPEEQQGASKARRDEILAYLQNAAGQQTSRASDTLFNAFTGERPATPTTQAAPMKSPYDFEMIKQKLEGEKMDRELQKGQIEKYAAEAYAKRQGKDPAVSGNWVTIGTVPGKTEKDVGKYVNMNKKTGELMTADAPLGTVDRNSMADFLKLTMAESGNDAAAARAALAAQTQRDIAEGRQSGKMSDEARLRLENELRMKADAARAKADMDRDQAKPVKPTAAPRGETFTPKEVQGVSQFDSNIAEVEEIKRKMAANPKYKDWVGPLDKQKSQLLPEGFGGISPEGNAFQSAIGRIADQYRHLITGAGAGVPEILKLEKNIPTTNDKEGAFEAKLDDYLDGMKRGRASYLSTLKMAGRKTDAFEKPTQSSMSPGIVKSGKGGIQYKFKGGDPKDKNNWEQVQ